MAIRRSYKFSDTQQGDIVSTYCDPEPYEDCDCDPDEQDCECGEVCYCVSRLVQKDNHNWAWSVKNLWTNGECGQPCGQLGNHRWPHYVRLLVRTPYARLVKVKT